MSVLTHSSNRKELINMMVLSGINTRVFYLLFAILTCLSSLATASPRMDPSKPDNGLESILKAYELGIEGLDESDCAHGDDAVTVVDEDDDVEIVGEIFSILNFVLGGTYSLHRKCSQRPRAAITRPPCAPGSPGWSSTRTMGNVCFRIKSVALSTVIHKSTMSIVRITQSCCLKRLDKKGMPFYMLGNGKPQQVE